MNPCIFCKIVQGDIPCTKVYEDERVLAFRDIQPQAPTHVIVVPKAHMDDVTACAKLEDAALQDVMRAAVKVAEAEGLLETGYRLVINCGSDAGQSVKHFHVHVLGGTPLKMEMA